MGKVRFKDVEVYDYEKKSFEKGDIELTVDDNTEAIVRSNQEVVKKLGRLISKP